MAAHRHDLLLLLLLLLHLLRLLLLRLLLLHVGRDLLQHVHARRHVGQTRRVHRHHVPVVRRRAAAATAQLPVVHQVGLHRGRAPRRRRRRRRCHRRHGRR